jgi:hypothetical protein
LSPTKRHTDITSEVWALISRNSPGNDQSGAAALVMRAAALRLGRNDPKRLARTLADIQVEAAGLKL